MTKPLSLRLALLPLIFLLILLAVNVSLFGDSAIEGANQLALILAAALAAVIGLRQKVEWTKLQSGMLEVMQIAIVPILMLLLIAALSSTWTISGIVPTLIYYGLQFADPNWFYAGAALVCAIVSTAVGSSWTTAATIGVAMIATGAGLGMSPAITAGAVVSGAYFGDKLSPLSDTTNLAAGVSGVELFSHVRYLALTTVPSFLIALLLFVFLGFRHSTSGDIPESQAMSDAIRGAILISGWLLLIPLVVIALIIRQVPALPVMLLATVLGALCALALQTDLVYAIGGSQDWTGLYRGVAQIIVGEAGISTGHPYSDKLLSTGGMAGMLNTIWLIVCAVAFGGLMESSGCLPRITNALKSLAKSRTSLVATTSGTCGVLNLTASEQYLTILVAGRMYAGMYEREGLATRNLSRTLEDSGTVTSVLVPWNTCGAYHAAVLGVATLTYLPFCFFNLISPIMTIIYMRFNIAIDEQISTQRFDL